ncbi:MAG: hypothetical protein HYZ54_14435 [Ignavibacteriae bacterium]|nr:hypothetical protein [Ignavibacteriota bacterium]
MKMKLITPLLFALMSVNASAIAGDQSFSFGFSGGYLVPIHSGSFTYINKDTPYSGKFRFSFDKGAGVWTALTGTFKLDKESKFSIGTSLGYSSFTSEDDKERDSYVATLTYGEKVTTVMFFYNKFSEFALNATLNLRYKPFESNGLGILAGASGSYLISNSYLFIYDTVYDASVPKVVKPYFNLNEPPIVGNFVPYYRDITHIAIIYYDGRLPDINLLQISLRTGLFYDFRVLGIILSPSIVYQYPLTKISSSQDWKIHRLICSIDARYQL